MKLKMEQSLAKFQHARFFDRQSYDFCDLSHLFNSTLEFNTGNHKCDFTDETLSFLPPGEHACCGIAFLLKHRILLYGRQCKATPHRVNIRCNLRKCKAVSLIQSAVGGSADENGKWGEFRIRYADGNCYCEPLIQYDNLNAWYQPLPGRRVRIAVMESPRPSPPSGAASVHSAESVSGERTGGDRTGKHFRRSHCSCRSHHDFPA